MRKKAIAFLVLVGLMALMFPGYALAVGDDQQITGNPCESLAITAPTDNTGLVFTVGDNEDADSDGDNAVLCKANVHYDVKINCDVAGNKTSAYMWEWTGAAYVESGLKLQTAMSMKEHSGGTYGAITGTATVISGFSNKPRTGNSGTTTYVDYKQPVDYGDEMLESNTYRHLLTYTIVHSGI